MYECHTVLLISIFSPFSWTKMRNSSFNSKCLKVKPTSVKKSKVLFTYKKKRYKHTRKNWTKTKKKQMQTECIRYVFYSRLKVEKITRKKEAKIDDKMNLFSLECVSVLSLQQKKYIAPRRVQFFLFKSLFYFFFCCLNFSIQQATNSQNLFKNFIFQVFFSGKF